MSILKRIALFVIVNIAVMITFTLVMALLEGFGVKLSEPGLRCRRGRHRWFLRGLH